MHHHQHESAVCVELGGKYPTLRGSAADRELTGTFERRGQTNCESVTLSSIVWLHMCVDNSVLVQVVRNSSLHFQ